MPLTAVERDEINRVWHQQIPWQDVIPGLERLRERYILSTLSNQNMSALVDIVKLSRLSFDCILSAELARTYKPSRQVYQLALDYLAVSPDEVMMVACHKYDLKAAKSFGFKRAFVPRPLEFGPSTKLDGALKLTSTSMPMILGQPRRETWSLINPLWLLIPYNRAAAKIALAPNVLRDSRNRCPLGSKAEMVSRRKKEGPLSTLKQTSRVYE